MSKNEIFNYLKQIVDKFEITRVNEILTENGIDIENIDEAKEAIISFAFDPKQIESAAESDIAMISQFIDLSSVESIVKAVSILSSEEKLQMYNQLGEKYLFPFFVFNNDDTKFCIELIKNPNISRDFALDILCLSSISDEVKNEFINNNFFDFSISAIGRIAKNFKEDSYKLNILDDDLMKEHENTWSIIASSLSDDYTKIEILNKIPKELFEENYPYYADIISSINNGELKMDCLKKYHDLLGNHFVTKIISRAKDDQFKIAALQEYSSFLDEVDKVEIIGSIETDKLKLEQMHINGINHIHDIVSIATSCKDATNVIECLNTVIEEKNSLYILSKLIHMERDDLNLIYEGLVPKLAPTICSLHNLNLEHFKYITEKFGFDIIKYLESDNVKKIINGPLEHIDKLKYLLSGSSMGMDDVNNIYNCLLQKKFVLEKSSVVHIFSSFNLAFDERNIQTITNNITEITNHKGILGVLDENNFLEKIREYGYDIDRTQDSFSKFMGDLCSDIMGEADFQKKQELKNLLHNVTDYYIRTSREQYAISHLGKMDEFLKLNKVADKEKQLKLIFERSKFDEIKEVIDKIDKTKIEDQEVLYLLSPIGRKIIDACIKFKQNPREYQDEEFTKKDLTSKYLKMFNGLMNVCYEQELLKGMCEDNDIMNLEVSHLNKASFYSTFVNLDYDVITTKLLPYDEKIEKLKTVLEKSKIFDWGDTFDSMLMDVDLDSKEGLQCALLNCGYILVEEYDCERITINNIISFADMNSYTSAIYKPLFEQENCSFLIHNPRPNESSMSKDDRIQKAKDYYTKMYERESITVPPIRKDYEIGENKKLKVVLGDVANPINLTLGERTGACMRIGGAGKSLFDFCALNENGFHIRFEDPETGKFISRVSCFRNGNTIFANQLRNSLDSKYSSEDLIKCLEKVANDLIGISKDSEMPIDNVVISNSFAAKNKGITIDLGVSDIKSGFNYFYSDVTNNAILLTSSNEGKLVPVQLSTNLPKYQPLRLETKKYLDNESAVNAVNHIKTVEKMLTGEPLENTELVKDAKIAITGEDWYIYVDQMGNIHNKVIDGINKQRRIYASNEMGSNLELLMQFVGTEQKGVGTNVK